VKKETLLIGTFILFLGIAVSAFFYVQNKSVTSSSLKANEQKEQSYAAKAKLTEEPKEVKIEHIDGEFALQKEMITVEDEEEVELEPETEEEVLMTEEPVITEDDTEAVYSSDSAYQAPTSSYTVPAGGSSGSSSSNYSGSSSSNYSGGSSDGNSSSSKGSSGDTSKEKAVDNNSGPSKEKDEPAEKPTPTPKPPVTEEPKEDAEQEQDSEQPEVPADDVEEKEEIEAVG
jgi:hypothetical protein